MPNEQEMKIGLDASDFASEAARMVDALKSIDTQILDSLATMQKFDKSDKSIAQVVKSINSLGQTVTQTRQIITKEVEGEIQQFEKLSTTVAESTVKLAELKRQADAIARAPILAQAQAISTPILNAVNEKGVVPGSTVQQAQVAKAQTSFTKTIAESGLSEAEIKQVTDRVLAGFTDIETGARAKVQAALLAVKSAYDKIYESAEKSTQKTIDNLNKQAAAAEKARAALDVQRQQALRDQQLPAAESRLRTAFPVPESASIAQINRYEAAIQSVLKLLSSGTITAQQFNNIFKQVQLNPKAAIPGLSSDENQLRGLLANLKTQFDEVGRSGSGAGERISISWQGALRIFETLVLRNIFHSIINQVQGAITASLEFERVVKRISIAANDQQYGQFFSQIGQQFGVDRIQLANASFAQLGGTLQDTGRSQDLVTRGLQLQSVTTLSLEQSIKLIDETIRAFNLSTLDAERVSNVLLTTMQRGNVNANEYASGLAHVSITAREAGITLEELNVLITTLTDKGARTSDAISSVEAIIKKLLTPTKDMQKLFEQWGVRDGPAAIAAFGGIAGVLQKIGTEIQSGGLAKLGDLEGEFKAIRGAMELLTSPDLIARLHEVGGAINNTSSALQNQSDRLNEAGSIWQIYGRLIKEAGQTAGSALLDLGAVFIDPLRLFGVGIEDSIRQMVKLREQTLNLVNDVENARARISRQPIIDFQHETQDILNIRAAERRALTDIIESYTNADRHIRSTLAQRYGAFTGDIGAMTQTVKKYLDDLSREADSAQKRLDTLEANRDRKLFERQIANLSPIEQRAAQETKVNQLQAEAERLIAAGGPENLDKARDKLKEAERILDRMYQKEEEAIRRGQELGVIFTQPINTAQEERNDELQRRLEQGIIDTNRNRYQDVLQRANQLAKFDADTLKTTTERRQEEERITREIERQIALRRNERIQQINEAFPHLNPIPLVPVPPSLPPPAPPPEAPPQLVPVPGAAGQGIFEQAPAPAGIRDNAWRIGRDDIGPGEFRDNAWRVGRDDIGPAGIRDNAWRVGRDDIEQNNAFIRQNDDLQRAEQERLRRIEEQNDDFRQQRQILDDILRRQREAQQPALIPGQQQAMGGFITPKYFAEGGPTGTDTIPAWLSPGEYVMDAQNTAKFFPQLVSMSMGVKPQNNNNSINVGDIHIAYQGTSSKETDVRRLGEQLRREIRRGTLRLD